MKEGWNPHEGFYWYEGAKYRLVDGLQILTLESPGSNIMTYQRRPYDMAEKYRKDLCKEVRMQRPMYGATYHWEYYNFGEARINRIGAIRYDVWNGWPTGFNDATEENKTPIQLEAMEMGERIRNESR